MQGGEGDDLHVDRGLATKVYSVGFGYASGSWLHLALERHTWGLGLKVWG